LGKSRNNMIREAIELWLKDHRPQAWPEHILQFKGIPNFASFEDTRKELLAPRDIL